MHVHYLEIQYVLLVFILFHCLAAQSSQNTRDGPIAKELDKYSDASIKVIQFYELCSSANLRVLVNPDHDSKRIVVSFGLVESRHQGCFSYFDVFLKENQRIIDSAKVSFNFTTEFAFHRFENVSCGTYEVSIQPCFNSWQCAAMIIKYPKKITMSSIDYMGLVPPEVSLYRNKLYKSWERKILTICLISLSIMLVIAGVLYYRFIVRKKYDAGHLRVKLKDLECGNEIDDAKDKDKNIEVFIINYHDEDTLKRVETLQKDILSNCPNSHISTIGNPSELNNFLTDPCGWLDRKLAKPKGDDVIKKIILVDSVGKMNAEIHENENETFIEAIEKLYRNFEGRRFDYANVFVVHFGVSRINMEKMSHIVEDMRYLIPDHLNYLYQDLLLVC